MRCTRREGWTLPSPGALLPFFVLAGCIEGQALHFSGPDALMFLVAVDERGALVGTPQGPFRRASEVRAVLSLPTERALLVLALDEGLVRERYPAYAPRADVEVSLIPATVEIEACTEHGLLEEERRLVVPLEAIESAITITSLSATTEPHPLPSGLALRFEARVCDRGPRVVLRAFAESASVFANTSTTVGPFQDLDALDADTLIVFGGRAVVIVRRGETPDPKRDVFALNDDVLRAPSSHDWQIKSGAVAPQPMADGTRQLLLGLTLLKSDAVPGEDPEVGAAVLELRLRPSGDFEVGRATTLGIHPNDPRISLRHLRFEADGRYAGVGFHAIVTSASPSALPVLEPTVGFEGRWRARLSAPNAPHVVVGASAQVFEGDVFEPFDRSRVSEVFGVGDLAFNAVTQLQDAEASMLAVGGGGRLMRRRTARDWVPYALDIPSAAVACGGAMSSCGRRTLGLELTRVLGVKDQGGVLVGSWACSGLFWRSGLDPCASVIATSETGIGFFPGQGVAAIYEHEGRIYVAVESQFLYEAELTDDPI